MIRRAGATRVTVMTVLALLLGLGLAGCSDDAEATERYCGALERANADVESLLAGDLGSVDLAGVADRAHALADDAPEEVRDEWESVVVAFRELEQGLTEAGLTLDELSTMIEGGSPELPEDVDRAQLIALAGRARTLFGEQMQEALATIDEHATDTCGLRIRS